MSPFVLGGNFWEKARALFIRSAKEVNPETVQGVPASAK